MKSENILDANDDFFSSWVCFYLAVVFYRPGSPKISLAGSILGSIWGSMKVHEGSLNLGTVGQ